MLHTMFKGSAIMVVLLVAGLGCDQGKTADAPAPAAAQAEAPAPDPKAETEPKAKVAEQAARAEKAAPAAEEAPCIQGDHRFRVEAIEAPLKKGEKAEVKLKVLPGEGYKINTEFPWKVTPKASEGLEMPSDAVARSSIVLADAAATVPIAVTGQKEGKWPLQAKAGLSVCNDERCEIIRGQCLSVDVTVQ